MTALPDKLNWYVNRLRSMSPGEVVHRVQEKTRKVTGKKNIPDFSPQVAQANGLPVLPGLKDAVTALLVADPALRDSWRGTATRVQQGQYHFLGQDWPQQAGIPDWQLDPVTGQRWPVDAYCFDINYRHTAQYGDVKYVWELGRLQHLHPVAALAYAEQDQALARLCLDQMLDWIGKNPPYQGVHWCSGIELALRAFSFVFCVSLLENFITSTEKTKILDSLYHHATWLYRYPSRFSSANNHLIAEAAGLYLLGELLPAGKETQVWRDYGRKTLEEEIQVQILPDGIGAEQSPTYTAFALEFFLLGDWLARQRGTPFPAAYHAQLQRAGRALRAFVDSKGHFPHIGDDDEGRVIFTGFGEAEDYVHSLLDMLAGATGDAGLAPPVAASTLRRAFFGSGRTATAAAAGVQVFPQGGYTIVRESLGDRESLLAFDHGPLGFLSIAAHGHADTLAVWWHVDGVPILVDAGTYLYHAGREWRSHFRGTPAHNTLSINGADSSIISGSFNWSHKAMGQLTASNTSLENWSLTGIHDGWQKRFGAIHRRTVAKAGKGFTVTDQLAGDGGPWQVESGFILAPQLTVHVDGNSLTIRHPVHNMTVRLVADGPLALRQEHGQDGPLRGWFSPAFGKKGPTTRLCFHGTLDAESPQIFTFTVD